MALNTFQKAQTYSEKRLRDSFYNQTLNITVQNLVDPVKHCISFQLYPRKKKYPISFYLVLTDFIHCFSPLGLTLHFSLVPFVLFGCSHLYKSSVRCVATTLRRWCVLYKYADPYSFFFFFSSFILLWIVILIHFIVILYTLSVSFISTVSCLSFFFCFQQFLISLLLVIILCGFQICEFFFWGQIWG